MLQLCSLFNLIVNSSSPNKKNIHERSEAGRGGILLLLSWLFYGNKKTQPEWYWKKMEIMALISTIPAEFISLLAEAIQ